MAGTTTYYGISYPTNTDYVKDGASAMQTIATGFDSAVAIPTYNNQTGTTYTFVLADTGKTVTSDNASAVTFTIPPQSSVAWAANTTLTVRNLGAGVVTIAGGAGVTVTNTAQTVAQYGEVKLIRTASNAWTVVPASGSPSGLVQITSGSIAGTASSVSLSNVFTSTYKNYRLLFQGTDSAGNSELRIRFRENTTDYTSNLYAFGGYQMSSAAVTSGIAGNNISYIYAGYFTNTGNATNDTSYVVIDINYYNSTNIKINYQYWDAYNYRGGFGAGNARSMTDGTGITILSANGNNITGNWALYGYN